MPHHGSGREYWGFLIQQDKQPTPLFRSLLLGMAHYIIKQVAPWEVKTLTPIKLANFYRLCGGNLDTFFLETPEPALAFIYKSMGCYHSLQPCKDPFLAPCIPALTNDGFVKWQTIQLLLCPEEHVPFMQEAVKRFEIKNPYDRELFPRSLPADCLPRNPDLEMTRWHDQVGQQLLRDSEQSQQQPRPQQLASSRRQPSANHSRGMSDVQSLGDSVSSTDDSSIVDAADYFQNNGRKTDSAGNVLAQPPRDKHRIHHSPPNLSSPAGLHAPSSGARRHSVPDHSRSTSFEARLHAKRVDQSDPSSPQGGTVPVPEKATQVRPNDGSAKHAFVPADQFPLPRNPVQNSNTRFDKRSSEQSLPHPRRGKSHDELSKSQRYNPTNQAEQPNIQFSQAVHRPAPTQLPVSDPRIAQTVPSKQVYAAEEKIQPKVRSGSGYIPPDYLGGMFPTTPQAHSMAPHGGIAGASQPPQQTPQMQQRPSEPIMQDMYHRGARVPAPYASSPSQWPAPNAASVNSGSSQAWHPPAAPHGSVAAASVPSPSTNQWQQTGAPVPQPQNATSPSWNVPPSDSQFHDAQLPRGQPQEVRFSDESQASSRGERMRRRTMEEMAREREREELNFEAGRRKSRYPGTRRSRSGDDQ